MRVYAKASAVDLPGGTADASRTKLTGSALISAFPAVVLVLLEVDAITLAVGLAKRAALPLGAVL